MSIEAETRPSRVLAWEACYNVRDLGGFRTNDGSETRWGALVRADNLVNLTPAGREALIQHGIRTIVDLRAASELETDPPPFADEANHRGIVSYHHLPFLDFDNDAIMRGLREAPTPADNYSRILDGFYPELRAILSAIAAAPPGGVLFHCHAGKDRTGLVAALLLSLAGVPDQDVAADYAESETHLHALYSQWLAKASDSEEYERLARSLRTLPETMLGVLGHLRDTYGGVEAYLTYIGLSEDEIAALRARLR